MNRALKEKANPEVEFVNDPMLKDLHKIQIKITQQIKNMSGNELSVFFKKRSKEVSK